MRIAKPAEGFKVKINQNVSDLVSSLEEKYPRILEHWQNVIDRLKHVAHKEGRDIDWGTPGHRLYIVEADDLIGTPRLKIIYMVLGDTLTIKVVG